MKKVNLRPFGVATSVGGIAADALHAPDPDINPIHNTEADLRGGVDNANKANGEYQGAITTRLAATEAQRDAKLKAMVFIGLVRELLRSSLGSRYSQHWNEVGFVSRSLAIPRDIPGLMTLLTAMQLYFTAHPEHEVADVATAVLAAALHKELTDAVGAFNKSRTQVRETKTARDIATAELRDRLQNLYRELQQFMKPNDPRWIEFGFTVPADLSVPQAPEGLAVVPGSTAGHLVPSWERAVNAARYRVYRKIAGTDTEFVRVGSFTGTTADLGGFASGAHVQFYVTAVNAAGESQASEIVEVTVA